jgi:hypothetical protein
MPRMGITLQVTPIRLDNATRCPHTHEPRVVTTAFFSLGRGEPNESLFSADRPDRCPLKGGLGRSAPRSATMKWRNDQRQYSHCLYQGDDEPLGRSARWMQAWGERAGPERPPEVRCRPPRWEGLVKRSHGESTRSGLQPTGKSPPASTPCTTGQRTNPEGFSPRKGCHARQESGTMAETGHLVYPVSVRDTAERGMG